MKQDKIFERIESFITPETKALIFDLDGTLVDSNPAHLAAWQKACKTFGLTYPVEKFFYFAGLPSTQIASEILKDHSVDGNDVSAEKISEMKEAAFEKYQEKISPIKPVLDILIKYRTDLKTGLGTGRIKTSAIHTLQTLDIFHLFDVIITADDVMAYKPAPDTFLKCAESLHVPPANCLVFEDAERGFTAAINAGMRVINVREYLGPESL